MVERNRDVTKRMQFSDRQFLRAQDFMVPPQLTVVMFPAPALVVEPV
jgi:hypothetical protein